MWTTKTKTKKEDEAYETLQTLCGAQVDFIDCCRCWGTNGGCLRQQWHNENKPRGQWMIEWMVSHAGDIAVLCLWLSLPQPGCCRHAVRPRGAEMWIVWGTQDSIVDCNRGKCSQESVGQNIYIIAAFSNPPPPSTFRPPLSTQGV